MELDESSWMNRKLNAIRGWDVACEGFGCSAVSRTAGLLVVLFTPPERPIRHMLRCRFIEAGRGQSGPDSILTQKKIARQQTADRTFALASLSGK
jgi:hypothetical protein